MSDNFGTGHQQTSINQANIIMRDKNISTTAAEIQGQGHLLDLLAKARSQNQN